MNASVRLATINIASGRGADGVVRTDRLAAAVAGLGADVVALQEVDHLLPRSGGVDQSAAVEAACTGTGPAWHSRFAAAVSGTPGPGGGSSPALSSTPGEAAYGVAIVTRYPIVSWRELRLSPARGRRPVMLPPGTMPPVWFIADEARVALAVVLRTPLGPLTVITTHLSFAPVRAAMQLRTLRRWATALPGPRLLLGDLNLPGSLPEKVSGWNPLVQARTFPATSPRVQLDHVLGDGLDHRVTAAGAVVVGGSDHRGLVVALTSR